MKIHLPEIKQRKRNLFVKKHKRLYLEPAGAAKLFSDQNKKLLKKQKQFEASITSLAVLLQETEKGASLKSFILKIIEVLYGFFPFDVVSVRLMNPTTQQIRYRYVCDKNGGFIDLDAITLEEELSMKVVAERKTQQHRAGQNYQYPVFLGIPLLYQNQMLGVVSFLTKGKSIDPFHISLAEICVSHLSLVVQGMGSKALLQENYYQVFRALIISLEAKDRYTQGHSQRVASYALQIGEKMGCSAHEMKVLEQAAYLHDIGKVAVSDSILKKPGRLTPEEFREIQTHVEKGESILRSLHFDEDIIQAAVSHHECFNGQGYPKKLKGEEISLLGRIINVADAYDAMTTSRPYRKAMSREFAKGQLIQCANVQFCPQVVRAFLSLDLFA